MGTLQGEFGVLVSQTEGLKSRNRNTLEEIEGLESRYLRPYG